MDVHQFEHNPKIFFDSSPHTCDFFEIMIFQKATGAIELNGELINIKKNSVFFICPFQKKSCHIQAEEVVGFHLVFQNDFFADFFNDQRFAYRLQYFYNAQQPQHVQLSDTEYSGIQYALNEIISEINSYQNDSSHIIRSILYFSLSKLNRLYSTHYKISPETQSNSAIHTFKELLEINIRSVYSVHDYCKLLQIDRHQLNEIVKKHTGHTSKQMIDHRRLQEIKTELRYTNKTVAEIAHMLNFGEATNMTRFFKKMEGINPTAYRKNFQIDRFFPQNDKAVLAENTQLCP